MSWWHKSCTLVQGHLNLGFQLRRWLIGVEYSDAGSGKEWRVCTLYVGPIWISITRWRTIG